jgi:hypothetical protein
MKNEIKGYVCVVEDYIGNKKNCRTFANSAVEARRRLMMKFHDCYVGPAIPFKEFMKERGVVMNRPTRFYSNKQEKQVAKAIRGKQVVNSGATAFSKGDVKTDEWLVECKTATTAKASFSIKKEWLQKNREEAFAMGKSYNALAFDFGTSNNRYYIIDEKTFVKMKDALYNYEGGKDE